VTPIDVPEALRQAVASVAPRFGERGLVQRWRLSPRTPRVLADRDRLQQVLTNLLANAERHCHDGGRVFLAAAPVGGRVEIAVADDGDGIAPEHLDRIFDRLYQVGDVVKQREKGAGLGLGLAIAKSIVEAHGGSIRVRSRPGQGATFRFSLPAAPADAVSAPAPTPTPPPAEGRSSRTQ
jgi:signal transduction histidine kinase